ncbi:alpha-galactosidase [Glycomyces harbinensis]|uniref:Alpha-galactosidase n=1 Tax=Glycomyces harbinensis TaxID=58114 RepID=A0A1G6XAM9_9ACTN|nr:alpha-galactosidase [Glycomyces harbinensis]SDD75132.1 alpha-galactosidase [Glycomyces harbinensis]
MTDPTPDVVHLRRAGTSVVVSLTDARLPRILHWGNDLGDLSGAELAAIQRATSPTIGDSAVTYPQPVPVVPQLAESWLGRPGVTGSREGRAWAPLFAATAIGFDDTGDAAVLEVDATDAASELALTVELRLEASGLLRARATLRNDGGPYRLDALELALPLPDRAEELLDLTGRWALERVPQRHPFPVGAWVRESRGGKPGLEAPTMLVAGETGFGFRGGDVWGAHLGWSGNQVLAAERTPAGTRVLRGGELLLADETVLGTGEAYRTPWLYGARGAGLDALAAQVHRHLRARPGHPRTARPVIVNTWEAVYFDHDPDRLLRLAERSAELGAERFVVDDGWFLGRRDDHTSLGDWTVDPEVWPEGLEPLADRVRELGMDFGLWFEPEMVNLDSELARAHPEWVFDGGHGPGPASRHQHVLDLGHDGAYRLVLDRISTLVGRLGIAYIKWDHNRYLTDAGHSTDGRPGVHRQTERAYRMMRELREAHPGLEIESCASGGGRIDLGVLEHTDRVWPSDCNDPSERIDIQRWTGLLMPPELQGTHIGAETSHTTRRVATLPFRAATVLWGHLGVEADLTRTDERTFAELKAWVDAHRGLRPLLHTGDVVHADTAPEFRLEGVVAADASEALYQFAVLARPAVWPPPRLRFPGLDPERRYRVEELAVTEAVPAGQRPPWMAADLVLPGRALAETGIEAPSLDVDRSVLLRLSDVG